MELKKETVIGLIVLILGVIVLDRHTIQSASNRSMPTIGILQYAEHPSLDAVREGFISELEESGYILDETVRIDYLNAQADQSNLKIMSERLVNQGSDLILTIATPATISIANETLSIPVLFTAVTDPVSSKLVESWEEPGGNITGTSDQVPIDQQIELLKRITPNAKKVGMIYNSSEDNSAIQAKEAKKILEASGITVVETTVTSTNDVQQSMTHLASQVDAVYIPTDNTLANTMATVGEIAKQAQIPIIAGSIDQVEIGGLATYGIDYFNLGKQTGRMANRILSDGALPANMQVETAEDIELYVNDEMAKSLNLDLNTIK